MENHMNLNLTDLTILLDRSGSMQAIAKDMQGGLDTFIKEQKSQLGEMNVTLVQFDNEYEEVFVTVPIRQVPSIEINPRGSTALLDSLARLIDDTGTRLSLIPEPWRPGNVIFVVITDGEENSSTKFNRKSVFDRITLQTKVYRWRFVYLGANQDAFAEASQVGIQQSITYAATPGGILRMASATSNYVTQARTGNDPDMDEIWQKTSTPTNQP